MAKAVIKSTFNKINKDPNNWFIVALWFGLFLCFATLSTKAIANDIYITQVGTNDDLDIEIKQDGENNKIDMSVGGSNNEIVIYQETDDSYVGYTTSWGPLQNYGGDLDGNNNILKVYQRCTAGASCKEDRFEFHIVGDNNDIIAGQGYHITTTKGLVTDNSEYGGQFMKLDVHGSNNEIVIYQETDDSYVGYTTSWGPLQNYGGDLDGNNNVLKVYQRCTAGANCKEDRFEFHIAGDNNDIIAGQGYHITTTKGIVTDNSEYGGQFMKLDVHGSNNEVIMSQRAANDEHSVTAYVYGSNNEVYTSQESNGNKTINLRLNNNGNDVDIIQGGSATHSATVTLNGTYSTDLDLTQYSDTAQSYSLTQTCQTNGGCSVQVTQN